MHELRHLFGGIGPEAVCPGLGTACTLNPHGCTIPFVSARCKCTCEEGSCPAIASIHMNIDVCARNDDPRAPLTQILFEEEQHVRYFKAMLRRAISRGEQREAREFSNKPDCDVVCKAWYEGIKREFEDDWVQRKKNRTRTISRMRRAVIVLAPCAVNWLLYAVFLIVRPPATALIEERERAQRMGVFALSSGEPLMLIAERPLYQWNEWHGGEATWVKVAEVLNGPALIAAKLAGDRSPSGTAFSGEPTYRRQSWVRAYAFLGVATIQWSIVGALAASLVGPRPKARSCSD